MKLSVVAGATSQSVNVFIRDSSSTTGAGLTGLAYNTASLTAYYTHAGANATATSITLATLAAVSSAYSSGGFKEIDSTNMPGWYRFDIPNACLATSKGRSVAIHLKGATNMAPLPIEIELTAWDNQDSVRGGLTALPNANAAASGGLMILGSNNTAAITIGNLTTGAISGTTLTLSGAVAFQSTFAVTGATTLTGNVSLGGTLSVSGTTSLGAVTITATGSSSGLTITGGPTCAVTQGALSLVGGSSTGAGMSMTVTDGHGLVITATGAGRHGMFVTGGSSGVANGAYFVAGGTGFGVRATSLDLVSNLSVGGTTTLTGAVTASNASNNITGITVAALANDSITSSAIATSAGTELAGAVWDLATSGHTTSGTFGAAVVAAGSAGDPWSTSLPGAYSSGTAGYIVGTNLDATVSSRMATYSQPTGFLAATFPATVASTTNITTVGAVSGNVSGSVGSLATQAKADVNAEVVDALATDTYAEPGQGAPSATTSLSAKLNYLYKWARNKVTQTSSQTSFYADDGTTVDHKATTSDNGTTFSRGEIASGP